MQRYESKLGAFRVLTGIGRPSRWPELSGERVAAVIALCREWVDYTVVDVGSSLENDEEISSDLFAPRRNAAAVTAVRDADGLIAVGAADPVGLSRFLRAYVDLEEVASTRDVTVVMNRVRASVIGMNPHGQVTQTLSRFRRNRVARAGAARPERARRRGAQWPHPRGLGTEVTGAAGDQDPRGEQDRATRLTLNHVDPQ